MALEDEVAATLAAARFAQAEAARAGGTVSLDTLRSFVFQGKDLPIAEVRGSRGIRKPARWHRPLSVRTTLSSPYYDTSDPDGESLIYAYQANRAGSAGKPDAYNGALRQALEDGTPLMHLWETVPGYYLVSWPTYVVADDPAAGQVTLSFDGPAATQRARAAAVTAREPLAPRYSVRSQRVRLHQAKFRDNVLAAYDERCCVCRLRHRGLLDAAHIRPDSSDDLTAVTSNGLSLCKIHHAAFDGHFLSINPDLRVVIRPDLLAEEDGPMLQHGLKEMHDQPISIPAQADAAPDREALAQRHRQFLEVAAHV